MTHCLFCLDFYHYGDRKNKAYALLIQKPVLQPVFDPKHPRNHENSFIALKNLNIAPKTELNPK